MARKYTREFYIPKGSTPVADPQSDAVAYIYKIAATRLSGGAVVERATNNRYGVALFVGKQSKPLWHYTFKTEARLEQAVCAAFKDRRMSIARKTKEAQERKEWKHDYKVGDIFNTCWGYDHTNIEYFEVVEVRGKHLILREIAQHREDDGWQRGRCVPQSGQYIGEPIRRLATKYGVRIDEVRTARKWNTHEVAGVKMGPARNWTAYH